VEAVHGITDHHGSEPPLSHKLQATEMAGAASDGPGQQRP